MPQADSQTTPKKRGGAVLILFILAFFTVMILRHETVKAIACTPAIEASKPDVIMLGAWWCTYCYQTRQYLQDHAISYCEYDMENSERGRQLYKENGGGAIPVLLIGNYRLRGYNPEAIEEALAEHHAMNKNKPAQ